MIWVQPHNTVWFMHLDRSLAEGLAGRKYNLEFGSSGKRWHEVTEADSGIYLEIGKSYDVASTESPDHGAKKAV